MKKIKVLLFICLITLVSAVGMAAVPNTHAATPSDEVCNSIDNTQNCSGGGATLNHVVKTVVSILSVVVGVAAVVMIVIAGMKYVTSGGDSSSISSAKTTLIYAIVGLIVAAMAQFIVRFVLSSVK